MSIDTVSLHAQGNPVHCQGASGRLAEQPIFGLLARAVGPKSLCHGVPAQRALASGGCGQVFEHAPLDAQGNPVIAQGVAPPDSTLARPPPPLHTQSILPFARSIPLSISQLTKVHMYINQHTLKHQKNKKYLKLKLSIDQYCGA